MSAPVDPVEAIVQRALRRERLTKAEINVALRACLTAEDGYVLAAADYGQVEARWLAWSADDLDALEVFRSGRDVYSRLVALRLWPCDETAFYQAYKAGDKQASQRRDTAKKAELGCGYGMGAPKFQITAEKGGLKWGPPCDGAHECVDPLCGRLERQVRGGREQTFTHGAATIVGAWRELHAPIVRFWAALNDAVTDACEGVQTRLGPYEFGRVDGDVWAVLPSGRPLVYRHARVSREGRKVEVIYDSPDPKEPIGRLYGGKIAENLTQAGCRELLADALVKAEKQGIPIVLHTHDELVGEVPEAYGEFGLACIKEIMYDLPTWAAGFPVKAAGFVSKRYRKG